MHKFTHAAHTLTCDLKGQLNKKTELFLWCCYQAIWVVLVWFANSSRFMHNYVLCYVQLNFC